VAASGVIDIEGCWQCGGGGDGGVVVASVEEAVVVSLVSILVAVASESEVSERGDNDVQLSTTIRGVEDGDDANDDKGLLDSVVVVLVVLA
jgi:hypothetical protein